MKTSKRGISLIVLVITIIVMIILATAIILSLNSSNISGKASEAKLTSDLASKKEAASVYVAEYELKVEKGKIDKSTTTVDAYVKAEMKKAGIDTSDVTIQDDGTILVGAAATFENNNIEMGTVVEGYKLNNTTTYTTSGKENTAKLNSETNKYEESVPQSNTVKRDEDVKWKYIGIDENGNVLLAGSVTASSTTMCLAGKGGYVYGPQELNKASDAMYSSSMGTARSMNIDDVIKILEYTGERGEYRNRSYVYRPLEKPVKIDDLVKAYGYSIKSLTPEENKKIGDYYTNAFRIVLENEEDLAVINQERMDLIYPQKENSLLTNTYWLADNSVTADFGDGYIYFSMRCIYATKVSGIGLFISEGSHAARTFAIRPVVTLNPSVQMTYENGVVKLK